MSYFLFLTSVVLCGLAIIGAGAYVVAVRQGYRAYTHVIFAFTYVFGVSVTGLLALTDEAMGLQTARAVVNVVGIAAMLDLIVRFRHPSVGAVRRAARADEDAEDARKHFQERAKEMKR